MPKTIQQCFDNFAKSVIARGAPDVQIKEMRTSFYAGALSMSHMFHECGESEVTEEQAVIRMNALEAEATQYFKQLAKEAPCQH